MTKYTSRDGKFTIEGVEWTYRESGEIRRDRLPAEKFRTGVRVSLARCLSAMCGNEWRWSSRPGGPVGFDPIKCPRCGASDAFDQNELLGKQSRGPAVPPRRA